MKKTFYIFLFLLPCMISLSQAQSKRTNIWYFGFFAGMDFNSGFPVALSHSAMGAYEGCSVMCDDNGNLLFYTQGMAVYNRFHATMPNGSGLLGGFSCSQAALIVPKPGSTSLYYLFTLDEMAGSNGLTYSIVDMTLGGGNGDVTNKNTLLLNSVPLTEKLAGTLHANGQDVWVAVHQNQSDTYYSYLVTASGINAPVITHAGSMHAGTDGWQGCMKFSPDGNKLAAAVYGASKVDLLDFDKTTGIFSNAATFTAPGPYYTYGVEFSPASTKLYSTGEISTGTDIYQFDLNAGSNAAAMASPVSVDFYPSFLHALQSAPDGKIYVNHFQDHWIGTINFPELAGAACNIVDSSVYLGANFCNLGLPNYISNYLSVTTGIHDVSSTAGAVTIFPDPFINELTIKTTGSQRSEIIIYDIASKKLFQQSFLNTTTISTSQLAKGIYFYEISNKDGVVKKGKLMKNSTL